MFGQLKYLTLFVSCFAAMALITSCRSANDKPDHEAYFAKHIDHAKNIAENMEHDKAMSYIDSVYRNFDKPGIGDLAQVYDFKSDHYLYYQNNYEKAMLYSDSLLQLLKPYYGKKQYRASYARAYMGKGNILYKQKYYSSAYEWYFLGKTMLNKDDKASYDRYMAQFNSSLALVSYEQGKYKQAIRLYHECLNKMASRTDYETFRLKQGTLDNIGLCYRNLKRPDDAIRYFEQAVTLLKAGLKKHADKGPFVGMALGLVYGNEADAYLQKNNYKKAEELYKAGIAINSQKGYLAGDARESRIKLASLYTRTARYAEAKQQLDEVRPILDTTYRPEMLGWLQTNAAYYHAVPGGNATEAYNYLSRYVVLKNEVQADMLKLAGANFNDQFDLLQQQFELRAGEKKSQLNNIIVFSICLIGVLLITLSSSLLLKKSLTKRDVAPIKSIDPKPTIVYKDQPERYTSE